MTLHILYYPTFAHTQLDYLAWLGKISLHNTFTEPLGTPLVSHDAAGLVD